jgi:hypothetical protein
MEGNEENDLFGILKGINKLTHKGNTYPNPHPTPPSFSGISDYPPISPLITSPATPSTPSSLSRHLSVGATDEVHSYLSHGEINSAFKVALNTRSLSTVCWLCDLIDPSDSRVTLSMSVLIALLHQLSFTFGVDNYRQSERKLRWMQHCVLRLNVSDPVVGTHVNAVCERVLATLNSVEVRSVCGGTQDYQILMVLLRSLSV